MRPVSTPLLVFLAALPLAAASSAQQTPLVGHLESADDCRLSSVTLNIDKGGVCVTTDSGGFVCAAPGQPGEEVRVLMPAHPKCLIFYPPDGRTTLKRPDSRESMTVTLVERDSPRWKSTDELRALLRNSGIRRDSQALSAGQLDERLKSWLSSIHEATGRDDDAFTRLLVRKQGQIQEYGRVSEVFKRYLNRAHELVDTFHRHAAEVAEIAGAGEFMAQQIRLYNPAFEELEEKGDTYQATVLSYWGDASAADYKRTLEATLEVHHKTIQGPVNGLNALINRLIRGSLKRKERERTQAELVAATERWAADADEQLKTLDKEIDRLLGQLKGTLADF